MSFYSQNKQRKTLKIIPIKKNFKKKVIKFSDKIQASPAKTIIKLKKKHQAKPNHCQKGISVPRFWSTLPSRCPPINRFQLPHKRLKVTSNDINVEGVVVVPRPLINQDRGSVTLFFHLPFGKSKFTNQLKGPALSSCVFVFRLHFSLQMFRMFVFFFANSSPETDTTIRSVQCIFFDDFFFECNAKRTKGSKIERKKRLKYFCWIYASFFTLLSQVSLRLPSVATPNNVELDMIFFLFSDFSFP